MFAWKRILDNKENPSKNMLNNEFIAQNGHNMHYKKDHDSAIIVTKRVLKIADLSERRLVKLANYQ